MMTRDHFEELSEPILQRLRAPMEAALRDSGMTLEQVMAAGPTQDYDPRYGSNEGFWTTAMFIEAVYDGVQAN